jgi:hypothetical protein
MGYIAEKNPKAGFLPEVFVSESTGLSVKDFNSKKDVDVLLDKTGDINYFTVSSEVDNGYFKNVYNGVGTLTLDETSFSSTGGYSFVYIEVSSGSIVYNGDTYNVGDKLTFLYKELSYSIINSFFKLGFVRDDYSFTPSSERKVFSNGSSIVKKETIEFSLSDLDTNEPNYDALKNIKRYNLVCFDENDNRSIVLISISSDVAPLVADGTLAQTIMGSKSGVNRDEFYKILSDVV